MTEYFVELEQVGSSGRVRFETTFGFSFTTELISAGQAKNLRGVRRARALGQERHRVIRLLSSCHGASFSSVGKGYVCYVCSKPAIYPFDLLNKEYPSFEGQLFTDFSNCVAMANVDDLSAVLLADRLIEVIEELWARTNNGETVRQILSSYDESLPL
jgi:hypothetical protein